MQVQLKGDEDMNSVEMMNLRILVKGDEDQPGTVKFEITSNEDIFFHYAVT